MKEGDTFDSPLKEPLLDVDGPPETEEVDPYGEVGPAILELVSTIDCFKMFKTQVNNMAAHFSVHKFGDCDIVTEPAEKTNIFMLLRGSVVIVGDERTHKTSNRQVRKTRHRRRKAEEKRQAEIEAGLAAPDEEVAEEAAEKPKAADPAKDPVAAKKEAKKAAAAAVAAAAQAAAEAEAKAALIPEFVSDFPFEMLNKSDYKLVDEVGTTFGNDKILSARNFRPSYVVSVSEDAVVLKFCVKIVEDTIKILANTGENKEKTDFFKEFLWFDNFT